MNYLAHLYLSDPEPLAWAGSLMGDFVKGAIPEYLPLILRRHIQLHRRIDSFTRRSSFFQNSRRRLNPRFRYARSILVDVFYDHFLACNWQDYSDQPLLDFTQLVYHGLQSNHELLGSELQLQLPRMIEHNWLYSYRRPEIIERVLWRLEDRLGNRLPISEGAGELLLFRDELSDDFSAFMIEVESFVASEKMQWSEN